MIFVGVHVAHIVVDAAVDAPDTLGKVCNGLVRLSECLVFTIKLPRQESSSSP